MSSTMDDFKIGLTNVRAIVGAVQSKHNFDFSHYALSSFQRRVGRILNIYKFKNVEELIEKINNDSKFYEEFLEEITVNTTEMFRDPTMWRFFKNKVIENLKDKPSIKIWHAGCSSGEEVYSMAILLKELGVYDKTELIATDINQTVIDKAKLGVYPIRNMDLNKENYARYGGHKSLEDYYSVSNSQAKMNNSLLDNVSFRVHNLAMDDPFSTFDIVLCRNVMIYFDKVLQEKVFSLFYKSIIKKGYFIIGSKESMIWSSVKNKFRKVDEKERIFQVIG